jgi:hypothetical protein
MNQKAQERMGNHLGGVRVPNEQLKPIECTSNSVNMFTALLEKIQGTKELVVASANGESSIIAAFAFLDAAKRRGKTGRFVSTPSAVDLDPLVKQAQERDDTTYIFFVQKESIDSITKLTFTSPVFTLDNTLRGPAEFVTGFAEYYVTLKSDLHKPTDTELLLWNEWKTTWRDMTLAWPMHANTPCESKRLIDRMMYWSVHVHDRYESVRTFQNNIVEHSNQNIGTNLLWYLSHTSGEKNIIDKCNCVVYASFSGENDLSHIDDVVISWMDVIRKRISGVLLSKGDKVKFVFIHDGDICEETKGKHSYTSAITKLIEMIMKEYGEKFDVMINMVSSQSTSAQSNHTSAYHVDESSGKIEWTHLTIEENTVKKFMSDFAKNNAGAMFESILPIAISPTTSKVELSLSDPVNSTKYTDFCVSAYNIASQLLHTDSVLNASCNNEVCKSKDTVLPLAIIQLGRLYAEPFWGLSAKEVNYVSNYLSLYEQATYNKEEINEGVPFTKSCNLRKDLTLAEFSLRFSEIVPSQKTFLQIAFEDIISAYSDKMMYKGIPVVTLEQTV